MTARARLAHLLGLTTLAITVPIFVAAGPQYYIGRGAEGGDVVLVAFAVALVPALVLWAAGLGAARIGPRAGQAVHLATVGLLIAALASVFVIPLGLPPLARAAAALAAGAGGTAWYRTSAGLRAALAVLAGAAVVVLAIYLLQPRMGQLTVGWDSGTPAAATAVAPERPSPVVVVVLDEMSGLSIMDRRGRLDARRLPNFARLAADATWYPNATSGRSDTEIAVPSLLSGRWASLDSVPTAERHPNTIFSLLRRSHAVHSSEPWTDLCPERLCPETSRRSRADRISELLGTVPLIAGQAIVPAAERIGVPRPRESSAPSRPEQVGQFIADLRPGERPGLHVMHVLLPHKPWRYLPTGERYADSVGRDRWLAGFHQWGEDPWVAAQAEQRYLLQVGYVDRLLGALIDRLKATGMYDETMLVLTADHGVSFRAGDQRRDATQTNGQDILSVPLLIKPPGQRRGRVDRGLARSVDVLPTIAEAQGVRIPWRVDGRSLARPVRRNRVWIENRSGGRVDWDAVTFSRRRDAALGEVVGRFGDGGAPEQIWRFGAREDLFDRPAGPLAGPPLDATADVAVAGLLRDHRPAPGRLSPARVAGTLKGISAGAPLALVLNGRVAATTRSYDGDRGVEFAAMVDPRRLRPGDNRPVLFAVEGRGASTRLRAVRLSP